MKSFKIVCAALLTALMLCACQSPARELPPEITTVPVMQSPSLKKAVESYVATGREQTFTYTDKNDAEIACVYRVPALRDDSDGAKAINAAIAAAYEDLFMQAQVAVNNNREPEPISIRYDAYLNDDIVTLLITSEGQGHLLHCRAFNYNKTTREQLDNEGLLRYVQCDSDSAYAALKKALTEDYMSKFKPEDFPDDYYYQLELTVGDEALREAQLFLNADAALYAVCTEHADVGSGAFEVLVAVG